MSVACEPPTKCKSSYLHILLFRNAVEERVVAELGVRYRFYANGDVVLLLGVLHVKFIPTGQIYAHVLEDRHSSS